MSGANVEVTFIMTACAATPFELQLMRQVRTAQYIHYLSVTRFHASWSQRWFEDTKTDFTSFKLIVLEISEFTQHSSILDTCLTQKLAQTLRLSPRQPRHACRTSYTQLDWTINQEITTALFKTFQYLHPTQTADTLSIQ